MKKIEKILIVDDEINILHSMKRQLRRLYDIDTASNGEEALNLARNKDINYSVLISDMTMPGIDGVTLLEEFKKYSPDTIRIMLTGNTDQDTAGNAINRGEVFRFLTKPCPTKKLIKTIKLARNCYIDRKKSQEKITAILQRVDSLTCELSATKNSDPLTALPNRSYFDTCLKNIFDNAKQTETEHLLCFIDIDQFNVINDVCGRDAGDELIQKVASKIKEYINNSDILARAGGDEFALLFPNSLKEDVMEKMMSIKKAIDHMQFVWDSKKYSISISGGIASNKDADCAEELFKLASSCCSYAKLTGRDCIYLYSADDSGLLQHNKELKWVNKINEALDENRFRLFCQAIAPTKPKGNAGFHYEVLVRMLDESGEMVMPGDFLPTVEKYNFARRLDRWIIDNVFWWLSSKPEHVKQLELCSINLSGNTLTDPEITNFIVNRLDDYRLSPEKICFEITETAAISNFDIALKLISSIKELGCKFALDDFGSGLSSFAYLKKLPVDYLKIDGQFVKHMLDNHIDHEIVKSINDIGHAIGMETIAEYVENKKIFSSLKLLGIDYAQGYGIGKPCPIENFSAEVSINNSLLDSERKIS